MNTKNFYGRKKELPGYQYLKVSDKDLKDQGPAAPILNKAIRGDKIDHWPEYTQKKLWCKLPECNATTQVVCTKCNVNLLQNVQH